jgi:protein O-GlcNAc transferase
VLTCAGETFASRVAGSILHAAGLPELVTSTLAEYEGLALRLAGDREELGAIKVRLERSRGELPLFDTPRFARDIESAFEWMMAQRG